MTSGFNFILKEFVRRWKWHPDDLGYRIVKVLDEECITMLHGILAKPAAGDPLYMYRMVEVTSQNVLALGETYSSALTRLREEEPLEMFNRYIKNTASTRDESFRPNKRHRVPTIPDIDKAAQNFKPGPGNKQAGPAKKPHRKPKPSAPAASSLGSVLFSVAAPQPQRGDSKPRAVPKVLVKLPIADQAHPKARAPGPGKCVQDLTKKNGKPPRSQGIKVNPVYIM